MSDTTSAPMKKMAALRWLVHHSPVTVASYTELADIYGWERAKTWKVVQEWRRKGYLETNTDPANGSLSLTIIPNVLPLGVSDDDSDDGNDTVREGAAPLPAAPDEEFYRGASEVVERKETPPDVVYGRVVGHPGPGFDVTDSFQHASTAERLLLLIALGLSATAAYMSVTGMVVLYPNDPTVIMVFGALIEAAKFVGAGVLAAGWRAYGLMRLVAGILLLVAATINAAGVYGKLIENHVGPAASRSAAFTERDANAGASIDTATARLADIDRRIGQIDTAVDTSTRRGRTRGAMNLADEQKRNRANLAAERDRVNGEIARLRADRTGATARHQEQEAATTPVRYAAALFEDLGIIAKGTDPETLIRWLTLMLLVSGDPLALALVMTVNSRTKRGGA